MTPDTRSVELPTGVTLQYVEQGDASGVPVLLLHGLSDSWHSWELVLGHLPSSLHVFAVSQRGHGDSTRPQGAYRYGDFARDAAAFLSSRGLERAVVVGHSMGSSIAQRFAVDYPQRTAGLVLVGAFHDLAGSAVLPELMAAVSGREDPVDREFIREFQQSTLAQPVSPPFFETVVDESSKLPARVWKELLQGLSQDGFAGRLGEIIAPTLLVWGDRDGSASRAEQDALAATIPDARLLVYEGHGHGLHWEAPERFASDLARFIGAIGA